VNISTRSLQYKMAGSARKFPFYSSSSSTGLSNFDHKCEQD
jgi:hypothetical protein